ncbi:MAG: tetratricopeptide repeat protein [bacterium]
MIRKFLYAVILILPALISLDASARSGAVKVITPEQARQEVQENWQSFRSVMTADKLDLARAKESFQTVLDKKWEGDLGDFPVLSLVMIEWADDLGEQGHPEIQKWLLSSATLLSPLSAEVEFAAGRYYLGGGEINPFKAASHYWSGARKLYQDFNTASRLYARLCAVPPLFLFIMGVMLAVTACCRYLPLLLHDFGDIFPRESLPAWMWGPLLLVGLLLPLAAGLWVWWLLAWILLVFSLYMTNGERALVYLWFTALLSMGFFVQNYGVMAAMRADEPLQAVIRARNGVPEPGDYQLIQNAMESRPESTLFSFVHARQSIKRGKIKSAGDAKELYKKSLQDQRTMQAALNNLAEIYFAAGKREAARDTLVQADKSGPSRAKVYFNLAQYHLAANNESQRNSYTNRVLELPEGDLSRLSKRATREFRLNRFFLPMKVPASLVWERARELTPEDAAVINATWKKWMGNLPGRGMPFLAVCLAGLVLMNVTRMIKNRTRLARRCASCGKPMCMRCHLPSKDPIICAQCYSVFRSHSGVDLQVKMQKRSRVQKYKDRWRRIAFTLSVVAPGSGQLLMGFTGGGVFLFAVAALTGAGLLSGLLVWPFPHALYSGGIGGASLAAICVYLVFMLISISVLRSQLEHWR